MSNIEMDKEIMDYLDSYKVDFPDEEEMEASIEYILANVEPKENKARVVQKRTKSLMIHCTRELLNFGWLFWGLNGMFIFLGMISLIQWKTNPYITSFALAPLPFLVGMFEILKSRDEGLMELEMTLKYNAQQILMSRLLVVGIYNLIINLGISFITIQINPEIIFTKLLLFWTIPYVVVTAIAFLFAMKTKGTVASGVFVSIWFALCFGVLQTEEMRDILLSMDTAKMTGLLITGLLLWIGQIIKINRMHVKGERYEA